MVGKQKMTIYYLTYIGFFIARVAKEINSHNKN